MAGITDINSGLSFKLGVKEYAAGDDHTQTFTTVGDIGGVGTLTDEAAQIDVPTYNSPYKRALTGQKSASWSITLNWKLSATDHKILKDAYDNNTKMSFLGTLERGAEKSGIFLTGYVSSFSGEVPLDGVVSAELSIAVDGGFDIVDIT